MRNLSPALKREIKAFWFLYSDITCDFMLPARADAPQSFEEGLAAFAALPPEWAQYELARPTYFYLDEDLGPESLTREDVRAQIEFRMGADLARQVYEDPAAVQARVVEMLAAYWEQSFAEEWSRLEPVLAEEVERASGRDPIELLGEVRAELKVDPEERLLLRRSLHHHEVEVTADNPLRLIPSAYVWPHVRVNCDPPWPLILIYAAPFVLRRVAREPLPPALVQTLRAVGDETRLRILKLIAERPRPTEELAPLVSLSEPALSRQLRILSEAGLVRPRRNGYYVLYALDREALDTLPAMLGGFLGP